MKNNKFLVAGLGVTMAIIIMVLAYFQYQTNIPMIIFTKEGSYASKYAKKHFLETHIVTTTELEQYTKNIETFSYQEKETGLAITSYKGISKRLVIPKTINGKRVIAIEKGAINNSVETIVISDFITVIDDELKTKNIECFKGDYCNTLASHGFHVTILNDSDYIDFNNTKTEFTYELKNGTMDLIEYQGNDKIAIVPTTINGYNVSKISCDSKSIIEIFIPETVQKIKGQFLSLFLNRTYLTIIVVTLSAIIIFLIMVLRTESKDLEDMTRNTIFYIVSLVYLCIIGIWIKLITDFTYGYKTLIIEALITTLIYIVIAVFLKLAKKKTETFETERKEQTTFITEASNIIEDVDPNDTYHIKEMIRFSDPVSIEQVREIEQTILELLQNMNEKNIEEIKKAIQKRNHLIKQNK